MRENAPSATANVVARNVVLIAGTPGFAELVPCDAARLSGWLVEDFSPGGRAFVRRSAKPWFQSLSRLRERLTIPGLALHQALRKRYIEAVVRESLAEGFEQLVVLGGGLDSLAMRLCCEFPRVDFIELDHPATQRVKRRVAVRRRLLNHNLKLLPIDFSRQRLEETLRDCPDYRAERRTVFISEGVLMYLEACEVDAVLAFIRRQGGAEKRLVFTFMEKDEKGRAAFRRTTWLARLWLKLRNEPFRWGLEPREAEGFLSARGFRLKETATAETFRERYLQERGLRDAAPAEGEHVCVCETEA